MQKFMEFLAKATDIRPLLALFKTGRVIRNTLSVLYRIVAVLLGLLVFIFWAKSWEAIRYMNFFGGVAFLLWQLSFPYAAYLALKALYVRAREIKDFPDSDYVVVPVIAMLTKTNGEMIFIFLAVMSIPATLLTWLGGGFLAEHIPILGVGNVFFAGILAFILSWLVGFLALIVTQFLAEWTLALFSIANDVNVLRRNTPPIRSQAVSETAPPVQEN